MSERDPMMTDVEREQLGQQLLRGQAVEKASEWTRRSGNTDLDVTNLLRIASFIHDGLIPESTSKTVALYHPNDSAFMEGVREAQRRGERLDRPADESGAYL